jgi:hypothetical protein
VAAEHDHRHPLPQRLQPLDRQLRGEQHEGLAAQVEQGLDDPLLVVARGDRAQRDRVAGGVGGQLQLLGQLGAEGVAQDQRHAQHPGPPAGQQAGRAVGPVAEAGGGLQDPLAPGS